MKLLAFETSASCAGVAVFLDEKLVAEEYRDNGLTHSQTLMPMALEVLQSVGLEAADMDAFAVDIGPGSFTGVRIGVCAANALAFGCQKQVVGVDSLLTLAMNVPHGLVSAVVDARADRIYAGLYNCQNGRPKQIGELFAGTIDQWLETLPREQLIFIGDGAAAQRQVILAANEKALFMPEQLNKQRASAVGAAALKMGIAPQKEWRPLYLRPAQAQRFKGANE